MSALTEAMVLQKARVGSLEMMKHLNFWGTDISDVSIIGRMPNLEVVSLSVNSIRTLRDFAHCPNLTEVYIRKNEISSLSELRHLQPLRRLRTLWLSHNPCASAPDYRLRVIRLLPQLTKLDNADVTSEERKLASALPENCDDVSIDPSAAAAVPEKQQPNPPKPAAVVLAKPPPQSTSSPSPPPPRGAEAFVIPVDSAEAQPLTREPQSARPSTGSSKASKQSRASSAGTRRASWQTAISVLPLQGQAAPPSSTEKDEVPRPVVHREDVLPVPEEAPRAIPPSREKKVPQSARPATSAPASPARSQQQERRPAVVTRPISRSSGSNVLRAVLTLLNELGEDDLQVVRSDIDSRLLVSAHQQKPFDRDEIL